MAKGGQRISLITCSGSIMLFVLMWRIQPEWDPKRLAVKVQIDFGSGSEGTTSATFEGDVTIKSVGLNLHVHGDKNLPPIGG
jgi:hypothetical protein